MGTRLKSTLSLTPHCSTLKRVWWESCFSGLKFYENIILSKPDADPADAIWAINTIGIDDAINAMPDGLDTKVSGANYDSLPVGVRQQIILVRSLVGCMSFGEPKIILFDDADSSLDVKHDQMLVNLLNELREKYTMVIISHRPSILRLCDRNYLLEDGDLIRLPWSRQKLNEDSQQSISA